RTRGAKPDTAVGGASLPRPRSHRDGALNETPSGLRTEVGEFRYSGSDNLASTSSTTMRTPATSIGVVSAIGFACLLGLLGPATDAVSHPAEPKPVRHMEHLGLGEGNREGAPDGGRV